MVINVTVNQVGQIIVQIDNVHLGVVVRKSNICANIQCAKEAECRETQLGPVCECFSGYVDISRQHGMAAGHVCRKVINECATGKHDCSSSASCIDTADLFTCRCRDGYRDESPDITNRPGRVCVKAFIPEPPECDVNDPMSCDAKKKKYVYLLMVHINVNVQPDMIVYRMVDADGYTCQCKNGFADLSSPDKPGRICRTRVNECAEPQKYHVDCDPNAVCIDTDEDYTCSCRPGFADISNSFERLPGRRCVEAINECLDASLNDCSENAICEDAKEGYICTCRQGFVDASHNITHYPGRVCHKPKQEKLNDNNLSKGSLITCNPDKPKCGTNEVCTDRKARGKFVCDCVENAFRFTDNTCRFYAACVGVNDCDKNAVCANAFDSYKCQCRPGFIDISPDPEGKPGRICKE
ncbi:transmembrane cell adhesion receptor mua-3, partial [Loa loa]